MKNMFGDDKKKLGNDARVNYQAANKSKIFSNQPEENTRDSKQILHKDAHKFEPQFEDVSSSTRKFREIHDAHKNVEDIKSKRTSSTFGHMKKENAGRQDEGVEKPSVLGTAWKKKLAELNPKLREEEIQQASQLKGTETFYAKRSLQQDAPVSSHKDAKVKELQSNIFYDITKNENPYPLQGNANVNTKNHKICDEESAHAVIIAYKPRATKVSNTFKHLVKEAEPQYEKMTTVDDTYNAKQMKKMNLLSHMDNHNIKRSVIDTEVARAERMAKENNEKAFVDVQSILFPESKAFLSKYKARSGHEGTAQEREYKIIPTKGFNYVQNAEIRLLFAKSGIQIYDIKDSVKQQEDSRSGQIAFKVRNNIDVGEFNYKLNQVTTRINKLGLHLKENTDHNLKTICDIVPADVKWNSTHVNTITDRRMEKSIPNPPQQKLPAHEKFSNHVSHQDIVFKNKYHAPIFGNSGAQSMRNSTIKY